MGFFSQAFLVFLMLESKKRRRKQAGKLMAKSHSQPVNLPGARPLMNPLGYLGSGLPCLHPRVTLVGRLPFPPVDTPGGVSHLPGVNFLLVSRTFKCNCAIICPRLYL